MALATQWWVWFLASDRGRIVKCLMNFHMNVLSAISIQLMQKNHVNRNQLHFNMIFNKTLILNN